VITKVTEPQMTGTLIEGLIEIVEKVERTPAQIIFSVWQYLRQFPRTEADKDACAILRDRWLGCEPTGIEHGYTNYDAWMEGR
jgi:hypothetical protein